MSASSDGSRGVRRTRPYVVALAVVLAIALAAFAVYALALGRGEAPFCGDIGVKILQTAALAEGDGAIAHPALELDPARESFPLRPPFVFEHEGRIYSVYLNPQVRLGSVLYRLGGIPLCSALSLLSVLATLGATFVLARRMQVRRSAAVAAAALGLFATPLWLYGCFYWEHAPAMLLSTLALALLRATPARLVLCGALFGLAASLRLESFLLLLSLCGALLALRRRFAAPALLCAAAVATYFAAVLLAQGELFFAYVEQYVAPHLEKGDLGRGELEMPSRSLVAYWLLTNSFGSPSAALSPFVAGALVCGVALLVGCAWVRHRAAARVTLSLEALLLILCGTAAAIALVHPTTYLRGLLVSCPLAILVSSQVARYLRTRGEELLALDTAMATLAAFTVAAILLAPNDGGTSWGPRFLLPAMPLFGILVAERWTLTGALEPTGLRRLERGVLIAGVSLSVLVQAIGMRNVAEVQAEKRALLAAVASRKEAWVLTSWRFFPQSAAMLWARGEKKIALVESPAALQQTVAALHQRGERSFLYVNLESGGTRSRRFGPYLEVESENARSQQFGVRVARFALEGSTR